MPSNYPWFPQFYSTYPYLIYQLHVLFHAPYPRATSFFPFFLILINLSVLAFLPPVLTCILPIRHYFLILIRILFE